MAFAALASAVMTGVGAYFAFFRQVVTKTECSEASELRSRPILVKIKGLEDGQEALRVDLREVRDDVKWLIRHTDGGRSKGE